MRTKLSAGVVAVVAASFTSVAAAAAVVSYTNQNTVFTVSNSDLLQSAGTTHENRNASGVVISDTDTLFTYADGNGGNLSSLGVPALTNGAYGVNGRPQADAEYAGIRGQNAGTSGLPLTVTYTFDTTGANANGISIGQIDIYTGWADVGRDNINTVITYATVGDPTNFQPLATAEYGTGTASPANNRARITDDGAGGVLASGVKSLRFGFPQQENIGVGYREIDVFPVGVPEPASVGVISLGALALMRRRRR